MTVRVLTGRAANKLREDGLLPLLRSIAQQAFQVRPFLAKLLIPRLIPILQRSDLQDVAIGYPYSRADELVLPGEYVANQELYEFDRLPSTFTFPRPAVYQLTDATILESVGWAVVEEGLVLETALARRDVVDEGVIHNPGLVRTIRSSRSGADVHERYDALCPLFHATGFSHWLMKGLPRLQGVLHFTERTGIDPHLLLPKDPPTYITESMAIFGFGDEQWSTWSGGSVHADRLVVPTYPCLEHPLSLYDHRLKYDLAYKAISPAACEWVRERALEGIDGSDRSERVYVSREDAEDRRVTNEEEVVDALRERGFEPYILSDLPLERQIELFGNAECIVGPHGAGLINMIFSRDCTVLEIFGKKVKPTPYLLANSVGLEYVALRQEAVDDDVVVDVERLTTCLDHIGVTSTI